MFVFELICCQIRDLWLQNQKHILTILYKESWDLKLYSLPAFLQPTPELKEFSCTPKKKVQSKHSIQPNPWKKFLLQELCLDFF